MEKPAPKAKPAAKPKAESKTEKPATAAKAAPTAKGRPTPATTAPPPEAEKVKPGPKAETEKSAAKKTTATPPEGVFVSVENLEKGKTYKVMKDDVESGLWEGDEASFRGTNRNGDLIFVTQSPTGSSVQTIVPKGTRLEGILQ